MMVIIAIMVQGNAVELEEGIGNFVTRRRKSAIERHACHVRLLGAANVYAFAFLDVSKVDSINTATSMGHDGWLHMSNQGPLRGSEEWVDFDIGRASTGTKSSVLIFDQQLANQGLAKTIGIVSFVTGIRTRNETYFEI